MAAEAEREPGGNIRETLGWLRAKVGQLEKGQAELRAEIREFREETRNINKRIDRLIWAMVGAGAVLGAGVLATLGGIIAVLVTG